MATYSERGNSGANQSRVSSRYEDNFGLSHEEGFNFSMRFPEEKANEQGALRNSSTGQRDSNHQIINDDRTNWVPNSKSKSCHNCDKEFGFFQRRHHCRNCYFVFCKNCTIKTNIGQFDNQSKKQRKRSGKKEDTVVRLCKACESSCNLLKREMNMQHDYNKRFHLREHNQKMFASQNDYEQLSVNQSIDSERNMLVQQRPAG